VPWPTILPLLQFPPPPSPIPRCWVFIITVHPLLSSHRPRCYCLGQRLLVVTPIHVGPEHPMLPLFPLSARSPVLMWVVASRLSAISLALPTSDTLGTPSGRLQLQNRCHCQPPHLDGRCSENPLSGPHHLRPDLTYTRWHNVLTDTTSLTIPSWWWMGSVVLSWIFGVVTVELEDVVHMHVGHCLSNLGCHE
jgi:hypothetical protein